MSLPKNHKFTPAAERLREHLRGLWAPIDWSKQGAEFDSENSLGMTTDFYSARAMARELGVSSGLVLKQIHLGIIKPTVRTGKVLGFTATDLATLRQKFSNQTKP